MKILVTALTLIVFTCSVSSIFAQDKLLLKSGDYTLESNVTKFIQSPNIADEEIVDDHYYRILSFSQTPTTADKNILKSSGITLLDYLPKKSFYASIKSDADLSVLEDLKVSSIVPIAKSYKLTPDLLNENYASWALRPNNQIALNLNYFSGLDKKFVIDEIEKTGAKVISDLFPMTLTVSVEFGKLNDLYNLPFCYYFEFIDSPPIAEGYKDVSNHRASWMHNSNGSGRSYTGNGVYVMMQDDGTIGPHIDYEGRTTSITTSNFGDHGDHVAGIIMGAGNLDEEVIGNAPGAHLYVYSSDNGNYGEVPELVETGNLVITSKSYGNGNNAGYTSLARTLDQQCREYDELIHVFSAGNSGTSNFGYGAGAGWGNITGGHKQGKNVLAVGNVSATDNLNTSSSRGPADDGRIKPDICAVGSNVNSTVDGNNYDLKTGTSMSCPGVAGCLALLYEAYRDLNGGQNPSAALMNGIILNSADDIGNPGPDFKFGWGRVNLRRAFQLLESNNYQWAQVPQNGVNQHIINVPPATKKMKIMVYWTDFEGSPSASKALVNDLNMSAVGPGGTTYQPLVLNPTPNPGLLDQDAEEGIDDLNNVEQIVIDNPTNGQYTVSVGGFDVPQGIQDYYIVYEIIQEDFVITYPIGGESLKPGSEYIRWDAIGEDQTFNLQYSTDGGLNWLTLVSTLPGSWRSYPWNIPTSAATGKAIIKITRGTESIESGEFSIMRRPNNLNVEWACPNSFNFSWDSIPGAVAYEVYLLGEKYMDSAGYTANTNATVYANSMQTQWVSVRAIGADGARSKRAISLEKSPGVFDCNLIDPVADFYGTCTETGPGSCVKFIDASANAGQGAAWEWYFPGGTPEYSNQSEPVICYAQEGIYNAKLIVRNGVGEDSLQINQMVTISPRNELPFSENFEDLQLPTDWTYSTQGSTTYSVITDLSAFDIGEGCFYFDNQSSDLNSFTQFMTDQYDFTQDEVAYELQFDVAHAQKGSSSDSLKVYVTNDCGNSRQLIYSSGGGALSTADPSNELFIPTKDEWRSEIVSLAEFSDWSSLSFIFEGFSDNGNSLYLDNLNVLVSQKNFSDYLITVFPNPFSDEINIAGLVEDESTTIRVHGANGQLVYENTFVATGGSQVLNASKWADGVYVININSPSKTHKTKLVKGDN